MSGKGKKTWQYPINGDLRLLIYRKHRLWARYQETKDNNLLVTYTSVRNLVKKKTKLVAQQHQSAVVKSCAHNPKKFWQFVKSKTCSSSGVADIKVNDGSSTRIVTSSLEKAELFSDYFASIYTAEPDGTFDKMPQVLPVNLQPRLEIDEAIVAKKLSLLKVDKSPGPDNIHPKVLFECRGSIVSYLTKLFNRSLCQSTVPDEWKTSLVTVLHKKDRKDCVENYRPVSLTCITCKLTESIICDYLMEYLLSYNAISNMQYGFISNRSVMLQLLRVLDDWSRALDAGHQVDVIYTDFEKAFDKVPHKRLLSKLCAYGVNEELIKWIESFLVSRFQRVRINGELSKAQPVLSGIPQGSVLGPILFIIYINDLPDMCSTLCNTYLFADDAKLYKCICNQQDAECLNVGFESMLQWSQTWLMKLNLNKCKVLSLCNNKKNIIKYDYGSNLHASSFMTLGRVESIKDLGVVVDSELQFMSHAHEKINLAYRMLGVIKRNFLNIGTDLFIILYKSFVRCHLEYANSVWNPYKIGIVHDLEKVQKRATKSIKGFSKLSYKERLIKLHLPTLKYRRLRGDMIEVFKILTNRYSPMVAPVLLRNVNCRTRGNALKLLVKRCKLDIRKFSFCERVVGIWNSLPNWVVESESLNSFKCNFDKFCKDKDLFYNYEASWHDVCYA